MVYHDLKVLDLPRWSKMTDEELLDAVREVIGVQFNHIGRRLIEAHLWANYGHKLQRRRIEWAMRELEAIRAPHAPLKRRRYLRLVS